MKKLILMRKHTASIGTVGVLYTEKLEELCQMLELPWENNKQNFSCIPKGKYHCQQITVDRNNPAFNHKAYEVQQVENRTDILIHTGNWAGDARKGYNTNSAGCLLPCLHLSQSNKNECGKYQWYGEQTQKAHEKILKETNNIPIILEIVEKYLA